MTDGSRLVINVRRASLPDASVISDLGVHVFTASFGHSVTPHQLQTFLDESYSTNATIRDITDPLKDMFVAANSKGDIYGFVLLTRGTSDPCIAHLESTIELQRVYVHPQKHGLGIGKMLIEEVEALGREWGYKHIWLGVWEENCKAQMVYQKLGYKVGGDHGFTIGDVVQTDHIMIKKL